MIDLLDTIEGWRAGGQRVALATVVGVERSAPRDPGAMLAVNDRGEIAGSVSGGCVEGAVYEEARDAIATGRARLVTYGISDDDAISVGLTCGGTIHVFIEPLDAAIFERLAAALRDAEPVALVTRLDGERSGAKLLVFAGEVLATLGDPRLDDAATGEARARLAVGENAIRSFGEHGEPIGDAVRVFICSYAPKPDMYIFGAIDFSRAMAHVGKTLGYRVTVVDARPLFATRARVPDADDVIVAWPDEFLAGARVDERSALIVLTHDVKFDVPLLQLAVRTSAAYIGAMGSRNTHANRIAALRGAGVGDDDIARIFAPVGLDIGARTPEETAVSIAAEIIAVREGRAGGHLTKSGLPIHNARSAAPV
jgi:xanthine dehydrogenase accessory factor